MKELLYGVAYYDEYMPYDRLEKDIEMMKKANINVVRIAESTWSTLEPQDGVFDFSSVDRVLDAMGKANISVIVGTPTYAVPTWLVKAYPNVLATTSKGKNLYGPRQNMDITNPDYLFYAERVIRKLISHVANHPAVIGYQIDNETKHYDVSGPAIGLQFTKYMKNRYKDLDEMNHRLGLDYWSNRINAWEDFPSMDMTINASLSGEFETFRRGLVTKFLAWQVDIVNEYKRDDQFVTQNFDFDWRGISFGIQPDVNHFEASKAFDVVGIDVYHPSQDELTGSEIAYTGDLARSLKQDNYLVLETQAQGHAGWLPYPGQLRLQAYSHVASGANLVAYWHWHSIHNSLETYWKGLLSQDFQENPTYNEALVIGGEFARLSPKLVNMKHKNKVAVLVDNTSLSGFNWFKFYYDMDYNTVFRNIYDGLYRLNISCDIIDTSYQNLDAYNVIIAAPLYAVSDDFLNRLNDFSHEGGHVVYTIRSGFSDEKVKVRTTNQPGIINQACGVSYSQHTEAKQTRLQSDVLNLEGLDLSLSGWIELINPGEGQALASYDHHVWKTYAAITHSAYGKGSATYIGCCPTKAVYEELWKYLFNQYNLFDDDFGLVFPIVHRKAVNEEGKAIHFLINYSSEDQYIESPFESSLELISGEIINKGQEIKLKAWDLVILEVSTRP